MYRIIEDLSLTKRHWIAIRRQDRYNCLSRQFDGESDPHGVVPLGLRLSLAILGLLWLTSTAPSSVPNLMAYDTGEMLLCALTRSEDTRTYRA